MSTVIPPEADIEELVPEDDTIIGKAFLWSIVVFAVIGAGVAGTMYALREPPPPAPREAPAYVPPSAADVVAEAPDAPFVDITREAGITFEHQNGACGEKLLPETMGGGAAFFDYDSDGDADLFLVNGDYWPGRRPEDSPSPTCALYRNDGKGRFENVSADSGMGITLYGMGVAVGDYDSDGDDDVYVTAVGENRLMRNDGGRFVDVSREAGVAGDAAGWSTSTGFFDYDRDGDLDLFVCNYIRWSRDIDFAVDYRLTGVGRAYGPPMNFEGAFNTLYRNEGDGRFTDVSASAGIEVRNAASGVPAGKALGLAFIDVDDDGWLDVFVANDTVQNFLFRNKGDGSFEEIGAASGIAFDGMGNARGAMGIDAGQLRGDGRLAIAIGNFANEMTALFVAGEEPLQFTDMAIAEGIGAASRSALTFGVLLMDYDLDGRLDLVQTNGHIEDEINTVQPSQHYRQPAQLFWNAGPGRRACFSEVPANRIGDLAQPIVGRGATYADIDGDGDLDVLLTQIGGPPLLLRNDQALGRHWLRLRLVGRQCNRDAVGARVDVVTPAGVQRRMVSPTRSYLSQTERTLSFGLGDTDIAEKIIIRWPDGTTSEHADVTVDRQHRITQGEQQD